MWDELGAPPANDQFEVSVLGPGHGESIVVHLGSGAWLVVDSCLGYAESHSVAAPLRYLKSLGVDVERSVRLVVASHWDDDHAGGIAQVVEQCKSAAFCCSLCLTKRDFVDFIEEFGTGSSATGGGNVGEYRSVLRLLADRGVRILRAVPGYVVYETDCVLVRTWSPSGIDEFEFLKHVSEEAARSGQTMRKASPGSPNLTSIVISIEWPDTAVLLGADLEASSDSRRGWGAVASEVTYRQFRKCDIVKIPHHGSQGAHDPLMWSELLEPFPGSVIAPFGRGPIDRRPPKSADVNRICRLSSWVGLTARHTKVVSQAGGMASAVRRSLREGGIRLAGQRAQMGIVRLRRQNGAWTREAFGSAFFPK